MICDYAGYRGTNRRRKQCQGSGDMSQHADVSPFTFVVPFLIICDHRKIYNGGQHLCDRGCFVGSSPEAGPGPPRGAVSFPCENKNSL
jgi:hypothetical protein